MLDHTFRRVAGLCQHAWGFLSSGLENACYLWVNSWRSSVGLPVSVSTRILLYAVVQVPCYHLTTTFRWLRWLLSSCDDEGPLFDDSWCYLGSGEGCWVETNSVNGIGGDKIMRLCTSVEDLRRSYDNRRVCPGGAASDLIGDQCLIVNLLRILLLMTCAAWWTIRIFLFVYGFMGALLATAAYVWFYSVKGAVHISLAVPW